MNRERKEIRLICQVLVTIGLATLTAVPALAQVPVDEYGKPIAPLVEGAAPETFDDEELPALTVAELEDIVGPVALYPDDLLAIVLPASTYPLQIVQAARFLEQLVTDPTLQPDEEWDDSVTALLNYPEVVELMNEDIDWTWRLGEAVVAQQADVIAAIEVFRDKAYAAGNLKSDEYQNVSNEDGVIEIEPASEDIIYVPYYEPERVVIYQPRPVYHYYPRAYPLYYYPYPYGYSFGSNYFWGLTTAFTVGWMTDHLHVYHHSYWGHPYYGHHYQSRFYYRRPSITHFNHYYVHNSQRHWNYHYRDGDYWRPRRHGGARPGHDSHRVHYYRDRNRDDWRHHGNGRQGDSHTNDGNHGVNSGARWASNRDSEQDRGDRQERNRHRSNPGDPPDRNSTASTDSNTIRFQPRDARARADAERRSTRAPEDLNRSSQRRTSFAASSRRHSSGSSNRGRNTSRTANPSTTVSHDRSQAAALSNPRRQVSPSPPLQARNAQNARVARANPPSFRSPPARSQPRPSAPQRSSAPPTISNQSSGSNRRSESRSSNSNSRRPSSGSESRTQRRHRK